MSIAAGRRSGRGNAVRGGDPVDLLEPRRLLAAITPLVQSITRSSPLILETSASSVTYQVTFDLPVTGVDASDFRAVPSGGATASGPISVSPVNSSTYSVTINGIHGTGSLTLNLVDNDSIQDAGFNPLGGPGPNNGSFSGPTYLIDR